MRFEASSKLWLAVPFRSAIVVKECNMPEGRLQIAWPLAANDRGAKSNI